MIVGLTVSVLITFAVIAVMAFFVVVVNRLFWQPLYWYAERRFRMGS